MTDFLRNFSWQFLFSLRVFFLDICREEIAEEILFVFRFDVWPGARTLTLRLISQHITDQTTQTTGLYLRVGLASCRICITLSYYTLIILKYVHIFNLFAYKLNWHSVYTSIFQFKTFLNRFVSLNALILSFFFSFLLKQGHTCKNSLNNKFKTKKEISLT